MNIKYLAFGAISLVYITHLHAHEEKKISRADSHAPISVMGDHLHKKGEWMFSYRLMHMEMGGVLSGSKSVSPDQVVTMANPLSGEMMRMGNLADGSPRIMMVPPNYRVSPLDMTMDMHMVSGMYGWSDDVTIMLMLPTINNKMTLRSYAGPSGTNAIGNFNGETSGVGDLKISSLIRFSEENNKKIHFDLGLSIPTGSIKERGAILPPFAGTMTPAGETVEIDRLGYSMQLGSGSFELLSGITFTDREQDLSWGAQVSTVIRLNDNSQDYKLGNRLQVQSWLANEWQSWISGSVGLKAYTQGNIQGRDDIITGGMPLFIADNSGRDLAELSLGVNLLGESGLLKGHRLAFEFAKPIYQKVNGIQMENDWSLTIGWQKAFK
ncbi:MAG: hypothetical protein L3J46_01345 [Kangiellaceae bacterium]|nr:hypothetical protein [Kangiellaceae bacterium]